MDKYVEVRWHGRGGQGAKTGSQLLAEVVAAAGKYIQSFPEYGPERTGAPMLAFNRFSDTPIRIHSSVDYPDMVVVLDGSLMEATDVTKGLKEGGTLLINSNLEPAELRKNLGPAHCNLAVVDASRIAKETVGKNVPNTAMVGAIVRLTGTLEHERFVQLMRELLREKFAHKPEVVDGNCKAVERAFQEVKVQ